MAGHAQPRFLSAFTAKHLQARVFHLKGRNMVKWQGAYENHQVDIRDDLDIARRERLLLRDKFDVTDERRIVDHE